jgi:hypothetical protein
MEWLQILAAFIIILLIILIGAIVTVIYFALKQRWELGYCVVAGLGLLMCGMGIYALEGYRENEIIKNELAQMAHAEGAVNRRIKNQQNRMLHNNPEGPEGYIDPDGPEGIQLNNLQNIARQYHEMGKMQ